MPTFTLECLADLSVNKSFHETLIRDYKRHGDSVSAIWSRLDTKQRLECVTACAARKLSQLRKSIRLLRSVSERDFDELIETILPEWTGDIEKGTLDADSYLGLIKYRATRSLSQLLHPSDGPWREDFPEIARHEVFHRIEYDFSAWTPISLTEDQYGDSLPRVPNDLPGLIQSMWDGRVAPDWASRTIFLRQSCMSHRCSLLITKILERGFQLEASRPPPRMRADPAAAPGNALSDKALSRNLSLINLRSGARCQRESLEIFLGMLNQNSAFLASVVEDFYHCRPELVLDTKGSEMPVRTPQHMSAALFEALRSGMRAAVHWKCIEELVDRLADFQADKFNQAFILQELVNMCHLEFNRAQTLLKRRIQRRTGAYAFTRKTEVYDKHGNLRITMNRSPDELLVADPLVRHLLHLCQPDIGVAKSVEWGDKLKAFCEAFSSEGARLHPGEGLALTDFKYIAQFIQKTSSVTSLPKVSQNKGQIFVSRLKGLESELDELKRHVDLREFVVPIKQLVDHDRAEEALDALDDFMDEKAGAALGFLYQDLIDECLSALEAHCRQAKNKARELKCAEPVFVSPSTPEARQLQIQTRRLKEKTRPSATALCGLSRREEFFDANEGSDESAPESKAPQTFRVSQAAANVFATLFDKSQARGTISWADFEAAMVELGFSVLPKFGSVYTFEPPASMGASKSFTIHRPHHSHIEGYSVAIYARRLNRVYGWDSDTFELA
ncbi:hypothetical protein HIM_04582 [Hirsutella minnesotensis 3608]|uniref:Uncharacterized protein n=1 Tax=Hirsutella minnesotensis 3608 TaxID=1043627 RepID=A0A0F7ZL88_9HYPO|nr:hypothetical protein HIM_04582 [Hirsutella minnesotensis 3608]